MKAQLHLTNIDMDAVAAIEKQLRTDLRDYIMDQPGPAYTIKTRVDMEMDTISNLARLKRMLPWLRVEIHQDCVTITNL